MAKSKAKKKLPRKKKAIRKRNHDIIENIMRRPEEYHPGYVEKVFQLCLLGSTDKEIANFFNVSEQTLNVWKEKHPEFVESIKEGKEGADARIADALYHRAKGFVHNDEDIRVIDGQIVKTQVKKIYPPDPTSIIFWMKNRKPKQWRDRQEDDVPPPPPININNIDLSKLDDATIRKILAAIKPEESKG